MLRAAFALSQPRWPQVIVALIVCTTVLALGWMGLRAQRAQLDARIGELVQAQLDEHARDRAALREAFDLDHKKLETLEREVNSLGMSRRLR